MYIHYTYVSISSKEADTDKNSFMMPKISVSEIRYTIHSTVHIVTVKRFPGLNNILLYTGSNEETRTLLKYVICQQEMFECRGFSNAIV